MDACYCLETVDNNDTVSNGFTQIETVAAEMTLYPSKQKTHLVDF